jgi:hypothetical protein
MFTFIFGGNVGAATPVHNPLEQPNNSTNTTTNTTASSTTNNSSTPNSGGGAAASPPLQSNPFQAFWGHAAGGTPASFFAGGTDGARGPQTTGFNEWQNIFGPNARAAPFGNGAGLSGVQVEVDVDDFPLSDFATAMRPFFPTTTTGEGEWPVRSCPPLSAEDIVSTFDIVPASTPARKCAATTAREESDCAICLELLFRLATQGGEVVLQATQSTKVQEDADGDGMTKSEKTAACVGATSPHPAPDQSSTGCALPSDSHDHNDDEADNATVREVYCGHRFHEACILHWVRSGHYTCPLCRAPLLYE